MSDPIYAVLLHVRSPMPPTVLQVLEKSATLISVTPTTPNQTSEPPTGHKKVQHYVNGKRHKGISGIDLLIETLRAHSGICTTDQLTKAFVDRGFAVSSASPIVSELIKAGKLRRLDQSRLALIGEAVVHKGAGV